MESPDIRESANISLSSKTKSIFFRYNYLFEDLLVYDPIITLLSEYKSYLLLNSDYKKLEEIYYQRPDKLSYDEYGTVDLWYLILYVNDVPSIMDFSVQNIYIPSVSSIHELIKNYIPDDKRSILYSAMEKVSESKKEILIR